MLSDRLQGGHLPGGVVNAAPVFQSQRMGFFTQPSSSNSGPINVYTPSGSEDTHRSIATELCRCGRCASPIVRQNVMW